LQFVKSIETAIQAGKTFINTPVPTWKRTQRNIHRWGKMGANKGARLESDLWECILILPNCNQTQMNIPN